MTLRVIASIRNGAADFAVDQIDVGSANAGGKVELYTGSPPASIGDATGESLICAFTLDDPAFGDAVGGVASANGLPKTQPSNVDGEIGWARILDKDENALWDEDDVSTSGSSAITVNTTTVSSGVDVELQSYDFSANDDT